MTTVANRKSVRMSGATEATPYLRKNWDVLSENVDLKTAVTVDLACGNGRNTNFMLASGISIDNAKAYDMVDDYGEKLLLGEEDIPLEDKSVDIVLANYIFMFLSPHECKNLVREIGRIAKVGCRVMVELETVKQSNTPDVESRDQLETLLKGLFMSNRFGFVKHSHGRFIAEKLAPIK